MGENLQPVPPLYLDGVLAHTQSVPQLDGFISRARDNLSVVRGEGHTQHILGMAYKSARGGAPEEEGLGHSLNNCKCCYSSFLGLIPVPVELHLLTTLDMVLMTAGPWLRICQKILSELQDMSSFPRGDWLTMSSVITRTLPYA